MEIRKGQRSALTQILQNTNPIFQIELSISGVDVDFSCFGLNMNDKLFNDDYMMFFNQPQTPCGAVLLTTETSSTIFSCDLSKLPEAVEKLSFTAAIDGQETMQQIQSGYLKFLVDGQEVACFNFDGSDFSNEKALILGDIYRKNGEWRFSAIGQGFNGGLEKIVSYFGGNTETTESVTTHEKKSMKFEGNIFTHIAEQAKHIETQWTEVFQGILNASEDYEHIDKDNLYALNTKFKTALARLNSDLESPTLILATTGTTSSGKSTIVNLLCGADLMPRMAGEMSAGVVYINHSPDKKRKLEIHQTEGASWECGEWHDLADEDIRVRLTDVMDKFNITRGSNNQPATPHIELTYPIAYFSNESLLNLTNIPSTTQFKIMDLPGLRNRNDETNSNDIKKCRDALCLVAYNMGEVDEEKRKCLVTQVLEQTKQMGGSPARMLFVLNRIDIFVQDHDKERRQFEHIKKTETEILDILNRELEEHRDVLGNLVFSPLSSLPALHAQRIKTDNSKVQAAEELDKHFTSLIPQGILDDLPRSTSKWNEREFDRVSEAVWQSSYGGEFFNNLDSHIQAHFPTLVVPTIVERFEHEVSDAIGEVVRTCYSELNSSKEDYEKACELLHLQNTQLREFFEQAQTTLEDAFNKLLEDLKKNPSDGKIFSYLVDDLVETDIYHNRITKDKLTPLYGWHRNLRDAGLALIEDVKRTLDSPNRTFSHTTSQLPVAVQNVLSTACNNYRKALKDQKKDLYEKQLRDFLNELDFVVNRVITSTSDIENERIYDAIELLMKHYLNYLQEGVQKIAPQWNLSIGHHVLKELSKPAIQTVRLTGNVKNSGDTERHFYTLWLFKHRKDELPTPAELHTEHSEEVSKQIFLLVEPFHKMIRDYLLQLNDKISTERARVMKDFETKLAQANAKHHENYDNVLRCWQPLHKQTEKLSRSLNELVEDGKSA